MAIAKSKYDASNIHDASTADIKKFASDEAGLEFEEGTSREYILEQIFETLQWLKKDPTEDATHVELKIAYSPEAGGKNPVRLGHNGRMMTLQREVQTVVPIEFYNVLMDINSLGYTIPPLDKQGRLKEGSPVTEKIFNTKYPVTIIKFINKGKK